MGLRGLNQWIFVKCLEKCLAHRKHSTLVSYCFGNLLMTEYLMRTTDKVFHPTYPKLNGEPPGRYLVLDVCSVAPTLPRTTLKSSSVRQSGRVGLFSRNVEHFWATPPPFGQAIPGLLGVCRRLAQ